VPADVVHAGENLGKTTGRRIVMFSPAGMEQFFPEAGAPGPDTKADAADAVWSALRHGWEFVSP
jgi:hypothetical protein